MRPNTFRVVCLCYIPWISSFRASMNVCVTRVTPDTWVSASYSICFDFFGWFLFPCCFFRLFWIWGATACWMPKPQNAEETLDLTRCSIHWAGVCMESWTVDMQTLNVVWEQLGEVSVVKFLCLPYHIISKWCIPSEATEVVILAGTSIVLRHTHTVSPHLIAACTTGVACCQQLQTDRISECWCLVVSSRNLFQMELDKFNGIEISWTWRLAFLRCQIQLVLPKPFRCLILCRSKT